MHECARCNADCDCEATPCQHLCLQLAATLELPPIDLTYRPDDPAEAVPFKAGDLITIGASKTRWRVSEVIIDGITMLRIVPVGR